MQDEITPQYIEDRALEARVQMAQVFEKSRVSKSAFYRWRRGEGSMLRLSKARLLDAIEELGA